MWWSFNPHHPRTFKGGTVNGSRYYIHVSRTINKNDKSGSVKKYYDNEILSTLLYYFIGVYIVNRMAYRVEEGEHDGKEKNDHKEDTVTDWRDRVDCWSNNGL